MPRRSSCPLARAVFRRTHSELPYCRIVISRCHSAATVPALHSEQAVREAATIYPAPCKLTFDLLTLEVVSESRVTWATCVPISVPLGLSVLDLGPMYASDRQKDRQTSDAHHRLMPPTVGAGHNKYITRSS